MSVLRTTLAATAAAAGFVTVTFSAATGHTAAGTPAPAYSICHEEDGSGTGQAFPCFWGGDSNGLGRTYVLTMPACSAAQVAVSDAFHARGLADPMAGLCEDLESLTGSF
jgi:hypothetical protein